MKLGKAIPYNLTIEASMNNGFIVTAGCIKLSFSKDEKSDLIDTFHDYINDPEAFEKRVMKALGNDVPDEVPFRPPLYQPTTGCV